MRFELGAQSMDVISLSCYVNYLSHKFEIYFHGNTSESVSDNFHSEPIWE